MIGPLRLVALVTAALAASRAQTSLPPSPLALPTERASNVFFAQADVNGVGPMWFCLDTGANLTVLDPAAARSLGLTVIDEGARSGVGSATGFTQLGRTRGVAVHVGGMPPFAPASLYVVPVRAMAGFLRHPIDGVLGVDFMRRHVVEFDYANGAVIVHEPATFAYHGPGQILPIDVTDNVLTVRAPITLPDGEVIAARWLVDTGRAGRPMLNAPFVKRHRLIDRFASHTELSMSQGVNGFMRARTARLGGLRFGALQLARPVVDLSEATAGLSATEAYDGHLGALLLSEFRLLIDFPGRRLVLEPKRAHSHAHTY